MNNQTNQTEAEVFEAVVRRPPTYKPAAPATAPTGTSPATNSAKKDETET